MRGPRFRGTLCTARQARPGFRLNQQAFGLWLRGGEPLTVPAWAQGWAYGSLRLWGTGGAL
eukprot:3588032-Lingulodinium_polyedra.AAC.2